MSAAVMAPEGVKNGTMKIAVAIHTLAELRELCAIMAGTEMVPKAYRGKKDDILVSVLHGQEVGLPPLQALQSIAVINGVPSIFGDAALALVRSSGKLEDFDEWLEVDGVRIDGPMDVVKLADVDKKNVVGFCMSKRIGMKARTTWFSVDDAKRAKLWLKKGYEGKETPWCTVPQRMLMWRPRGWNLRDNFGDVLKGLAIYEEVMDLPGEVEEKPVTVTVEKPVVPAASSQAKGAAILDKLKAKGVEPIQVAVPAEPAIVDAEVVASGPVATDVPTDLDAEKLKLMIHDRIMALSMSNSGSAILNGIRKTFKLKAAEEMPELNRSLFLDALDDGIEKLKAMTKDKASGQ